MAAGLDVAKGLRLRTVSGGGWWVVTQQRSDDRWSSTVCVKQAVGVELDAVICAQDKQAELEAVVKGAIQRKSARRLGELK